MPRPVAPAARRSILPGRSPLRRLAGLLPLLLLATHVAPPTEACRIVIRPPHPPHQPPPPRAPALVALQHVDLHEEVDVRDQVAVHTLRATFHNPHPSIVEGTYYLEMDPGAEVSRFTLTVNGKEVAAELLDAVKARTIYQSIVQQMRDPALLEYVGSQLLQAKIFPIPANGNVHVSVQYTQTLECTAGVVRINALDALSRTAEQPIPSVSFKATLESSIPIKSVFSPTHDIDVARTSDMKVQASFEKRNYLPKSWLTLYYSLAPDDVGIHALTGMDDGGRQYVMLTCTPKVAWEEKDRIPKDVVFVLDTSGSMAGDKIRQAQKALAYCVNRLAPDDRFNVIDFSTEARTYSETLVQVSTESRQGALKYLERLEARGGTAIAEALERALGFFAADPARISILVFLTDGLPTIGERDPDLLLRRVKDWNKASARAFVFGVGHDVNTRFLDRLAADHGGARDYVAPQEDIEIKVSAFYDKVNAPILTDVSVNIDGGRLFDVYPRRPPDLFRGSQLVLFGRWEGEGKREVTLTGRVRGERRTHRAVVDFSSPALRHDLVPRLWATRKVASLLEDLRLRGVEQEVVDEVVALAKQYGIVTPYTSYLITEDAPASETPPPPGRPRPIPAPIRDGWRGDREGNELRRAVSETPPSGARAFEAAKAMSRLGGGAAGAPPAASAPSADSTERLALEIARDMGVNESRLRRQIRHVGSKTFYGSGGVWYDSLFKESDAASARTIRFLSPEYAALLQEKPGIAKYLALGEELYVVYQGVLYHVVRE